MELLILIASAVIGVPFGRAVYRLANVFIKE